MTELYKFKKDDPEYQQKRHKHLVELTKDRYKNDEVFREKCKELARTHYQKLKTMAMANAHVA
jgi:hypothetical protein